MGGGTQHGSGKSRTPHPSLLVLNELIPVTSQMVLVTSQMVIEKWQQEVSNNITRLVNPQQDALQPLPVFYSEGNSSQITDLVKELKLQLNPEVAKKSTLR